jgi:hypothetical protein
MIKNPTNVNITRARKLAKNILMKLLMGYIFLNSCKNKDI